MIYKKLTFFAAGLTVLVASLMPGHVNALSTALMTLSGASNNNGNFTVTVYENTNNDTVTTVYLDLAFSQAVSNVSYDYSVGPFKTATPSGAHVAQGTVTGQQPVATVRFTLPNPGTVTATVSSSSFMKHAEGNTVENFVIDRGSADFTHTTPVAAAPSTTSNKPAPVAKKATPAANNIAVAAPANEDPASEKPKDEVKGESTKKDDNKEENKRDETKSASSNGGSAWSILALIVAGVVAFIAGRRYVSHRAAIAKAAAEAKAAAARSKENKKTTGKPNQQSKKKPSKKSKK